MYDNNFMITDGPHLMNLSPKGMEASLKWQREMWDVTVGAEALLAQAIMRGQIQGETTEADWKAAVRTSQSIYMTNVRK